MGKRFVLRGWEVSDIVKKLKWKSYSYRTTIVATKQRSAAYRFLFWNELLTLHTLTFPSPPTHCMRLVISITDPQMFWQSAADTRGMSDFCRLIGVDWTAKGKINLFPNRLQSVPVVEDSGCIEDNAYHWDKREQKSSSTKKVWLWWVKQINFCLICNPTNQATSHYLDNCKLRV